MSNAKNAVVKHFPYMLSLGAFGVLNLTTPAIAAHPSVHEDCAFSALELGFATMPTTTQAPNGTKTIKTGSCDTEAGTCQIISVSFPADQNAAIFKASNGIAVDDKNGPTQGITASVVVPFRDKTGDKLNLATVRFDAGATEDERQTIKTSLVDTVKAYGECVASQKPTVGQPSLYGMDSAALKDAEVAFNEAMRSKNPNTPAYRLKMADGPTKN